jgi:hypothetical protein
MVDATSRLGVAARAPAADTRLVSARFYLTIGIAVAAVAFGGWRMLLPASGSDAKQVEGAVSSVLDTLTRAQFTGAQATLDAQRNATGSYEGAPVALPVTLVRADASSYCIQYAQGAVVRHLAGPGGTPEPGPC